MNDKIRTLMNGVFGRPVPADFATADYDYESALRDQLKTLLCDKDGRINRYKYERCKIDLFELLSENLEEVLPNRLDQALNLFTEVRRIPNGARPEFRITRGKQRGKQFVTRATESGNYEAFRLDHDHFDVYPVAIGGSGILDFERYLDGIETLVEIYEVINEGIIDRIFEMVQETLLQSWNLAGRPARNKVVTNTFDVPAMVKLCNTVAAYGTPVIYCTRDFAAMMTNVIVYNNTTKISDQDMDDIRRQGYIGTFYGNPIVVMPQSFTDETNTKFVMNPCMAYVIPAGKEKIVKLIFEGQPYFRDWEHEGDNGVQVQAYLKVGCGIVTTPNYWGIYYNRAIDAGGWEDYNKNLIPKE